MASTVVIGMFLAFLSTPILSEFISSFPVISEHPISVTVPRKSPVTLNCGVSGSPQPTVSWFKDGSPVKTGAGDHLMILPDGSLFFLRTVQNKKKQDSGEYRCQAENQHGAVLSNPATLTVTFLREKFGVVPTNIEALDGNDVKLSCLAPEGNPKPTIRWIKDGETVGRKADSSGSLVMKSSRVADSGQYSCMVSNPVGVRQGKAITVVVQPRTPPTITTAKIIHSTSGLVKWLPQKAATGYYVSVFQNGVQIKNITMERDVTQTILHNLAKGQIYSVQISAIHGTASTDQSSRHILKPLAEEVILHSPTDDIPVWLWMLAVMVVIVVTTLIIVVAAVICHRTSKLRLNLKHQSQSAYQVQNEVRNKKKKWINQSWTLNSGSKVSAFGSKRGLINDSHYDYALPDVYNYSHDYNAKDSAHDYKDSAKDSAHYASNTIFKQSYYLPLSQTKVDDGQTHNSYRKQNESVSLSTQ